MTLPASAPEVREQQLGWWIMATVTRVIAVLLLPKHVPDIIKLGKAIVTAMTGNAFFASPTPTLATVTSDIGALDTAETVAKTRAKGSAAARNVKLKVVEADLHGLCAYVQFVADTDLDNAVAIIQSAGLSVKKHAVRVKADLSVKPGKLPGEALLEAKAAAARASYDWQYSADQKTWTPLATTLVAKTSVSGLTAGTTYWFRHRVLTQKDGQSDWHAMASLTLR